MTTYLITAPHFCSACIVDGNTVIQTAPILKWTIGRDWPHVRDYCKQRGWQVEACLPAERPTWIEHRGRAYEFHWRGRDLSRVLLHEDGTIKEIPFCKLPPEIQELVLS